MSFLLKEPQESSSGGYHKRMKEELMKREMDMCRYLDG